MFGSLDFHRYTGNIVEPNIVKSGFRSIQFTVTFEKSRADVKLTKMQTVLLVFGHFEF